VEPNNKASDYTARGRLLHSCSIFDKCNTQCKIDLLLNGVSVMDVFIQTTQHNDRYQSSRGIMLRLKTNDELRASVTLGCALAIDKKHMILSGFLIHT
jgi:hypothetical protein